MSKYVIDEQTLITVANAYKRGKFPDIFLADNKLTPQPILYIDFVDNGTDNPYSKTDETLIEYGYEKNNKGILTPVAYTNENHVDKYFYLGKSNLLGITGTFDRWQKIETDSYGEGSHGWEINKCYVYTKPFMISLDFNDLESDLNSLIAPFENPVEVAIPSITLDTTKGDITSTTTQEAGYCKGGTQTETLGLPIMEIKENPIIPTTSEQRVVSAGYFVTEELKVAPIPEAWVKPSNTITTTSKELEGRTGESYTIPAKTYCKNDLTIKSKYTPNVTTTGGRLNISTPKGSSITYPENGQCNATGLMLSIEHGWDMSVAASCTITITEPSNHNDLIFEKIVYLPAQLIITANNYIVVSNGTASTGSITRSSYNSAINLEISTATLYSATSLNNLKPEDKPSFTLKTLI